MSLGHTKIPYLDRLWHPTTGCSRGCPGCWARSLVCTRLAGKMKGLPAAVTSSGYPDYEAEDGDPFAPTFHAGRLEDPLRARKHQVIGVSFFGDLFDHGISSEQIAAVFGVMAASPQHTFIVLTKQAERMARWFESTKTLPHPPDRMGVRSYPAPWTPEYLRPGWPTDKMAHVWVGVSVTCQADADERIPHLLRTPAAHRWVSVEPMVGPIDLTRIPLLPPPADELDPRADLNALTGIVAGPDDRWPRLDLVICGGQSGPGAVPFHDGWARSLRDQCASAGVPFYFKQRSGMHPEPEPELDGVRHTALPWRKPASGTHGPTREEYRWGWKP